MYKCRKQIGFARCISDYTTFAYLADVLSDPAEQQKGYGKQFVKEILNCQELQGLRRWHLSTTDARSFYSDLGCLVVSNPEGQMELRIKPDC